MKILHLTDATYRAVADLATLPFQSTGKRQPDGSWLVPIEDYTWARLARMRQPGETDEDIVARLIHAWKGPPSH